MRAESKSKSEPKIKQDNPDNPLNRPTPKTTGGGAGTSKPIESPTLKARKEANRALADKYCTSDGTKLTQEQVEERITEAAKLGTIAYELERPELLAATGIRAPILDELVAEVREEERGRPPEPPPIDIEALATSAQDIIASDDVLDMLAKHVRQSIAGEKQLVKLLYLVGTSRLFEKAMHAVVKGPSSAGKSVVRKGTLDYFPPEDIVSFTVLSEKALLYYKGEFSHKIFSMGEACGHEENNLQDYLLRTLMSENRIDYPVAVKRGSAIETVTITKHGPVAFLVTTTRNALHAENETRMLSLEVNDTEEQTERVVMKVAETEGFNWTPTEADLKPWQDYQRWLSAGECRVFVPYAKTLGRLLRSTKAVRLRRDFGQLLRAIKAHALLHREHRARDDDGAIIATVNDYTVVRSLMGFLLSAASELKMRNAIAETIKVVGELELESGGATVRQVAEALNLDRSTAQRRLRKALSDGYLTNLETRRYAAARYSTSGVPPCEETLLPTTKSLQLAMKEEASLQQ